MKKIRLLLLTINFIITTAFSFYGMYVIVDSGYAKQVGESLSQIGFISSIRLIPFICFFIVIIVNILFLLTHTKKDQTKEAVQITNAVGTISISAQSIESLARLEAQQVEDVSDIRTRIISIDNKASVEVMVKVPPTVSIPEISELLQTRIKNKIHQTTGIDIAGVRVMIDGVIEPNVNNKG